MHRFSTRIVAAVAGVVTALALAGCSTGHISQSANQSSAVNGTGGVLGHLALRNVHIQADQSGDFLPPGKTVDLLFVVSNQSPDTNDELTSISTDIGKVALNGSKKVPAGGKLVVGTPAGQDAAPMNAIQALREVEDATIAAATVTLDKPISNGLTYEFTFEFKEAGQLTLAVPISNGPAPPPVLAD